MESTLSRPLSLGGRSFLSVAKGAWTSLQSDYYLLYYYCIEMLLHVVRYAYTIKKTKTCRQKLVLFTWPQFRFLARNKRYIYCDPTFCSHFKKCTKNSPLKNQTHSYVQYVNCGIACVSSREARDSYSYSKMVGYCG